MFFFFFFSYVTTYMFTSVAAIKNLLARWWCHGINHRGVLLKKLWLVGGLVAINFIYHAEWFFVPSFWCSYPHLVGGLEHQFYFPILTGFMSSCQLTNSYFCGGVAKNHPPGELIYLCAGKWWFFTRGCHFLVPYWLKLHVAQGPFVNPTSHGKLAICRGWRPPGLLYRRLK